MIITAIPTLFVVQYIQLNNSHRRLSPGSSAATNSMDTQLSIARGVHYWK